MHCGQAPLRGASCSSSRGGRQSKHRLALSISTLNGNLCRRTTVTGFAPRASEHLLFNVFVSSPHGLGWDVHPSLAHFNPFFYLFFGMDGVNTARTQQFRSNVNVNREFIQRRIGSVSTALGMFSNPQIIPGASEHKLLARFKSVEHEQF